MRKKLTAVVGGQLDFASPRLGSRDAAHQDLRARPHARGLDGDQLAHPGQLDRPLYLKRLARLYPGRRIWIRHRRRMAEPARGRNAAVSVRSVSPCDSV